MDVNLAAKSVDPLDQTPDSPPAPHLVEVGGGPGVLHLAAPRGRPPPQQRVLPPRSLLREAVVPQPRERERAHVTVVPRDAQLPSLVINLCVTSQVREQTQVKEGLREPSVSDLS